MRIALVINADQPTVEAIRAPVARLRASGHRVHPRLTFEGGDARRIARKAAEKGADVVIAAGGDGTINEVVNGVHDFLEERGSEEACPRLGIVPLGTANDFASALKIPSVLDDAIDVAVSGELLKTDIGLVNQRCFVNVSTGGFGAEATEQTPDEIKRALGSLAYLITGAKKFAMREVSEARFSDGGLIYEGPFLLYAVGNSWRTGGGNRLTPRAAVTDGKLDLCVVPEMSPIDFMRLLPNLRSGSHLDHPGVIYKQVRNLTVESETELSVNADGEPLNAKRLEYRVSPHRIPVAVPSVAEVGPED